MKFPLLLHHVSQESDSSNKTLYCLPQAAPNWMFGMSISAHFVMAQKKIIKGAATHVIASSIQTQSLKQDMGLVMLQKERISRVD